MFKYCWLPANKNLLQPCLHDKFKGNKEEKNKGKKEGQEVEEGGRPEEE